MRVVTSKRIFFIAIWLLVLSGCASYQAKPLPGGENLARSVADIRIDRDLIALPQLKAHAFAEGGVLDMDGVAVLAVVNNPDLKLARADARIAHAQAFAAGLLPDPTLSLTRDFPQNGGPGSSSAFNANLGFDLNALLRHPSDSKAAELDARKTDLNLLWQEWQVVARARALYIRQVQDRRLMQVLQDNRALFADRYQRTQTALDRSLLTLDAVTPQLSALQDTQRQIHELERQINTDSHDLNALLGVAPEVQLPLGDALALPPLDEAAVLAALSQLPARRPDLMALQSGYGAEDARYRAAILGQFPTFTVGFTRARDTSHVYTNGFGISLSLPIFNGNRGNIAIEQATRDKLHEDYQGRLNAASSDVHRLLDEQRINLRQLQETEQGLKRLMQAAAQWQRAFEMRQIDALAYANLQASVLAKQIEKINLEQAILLQRVALQTLLGGELPQVPNGGNGS
ncbi:MAG: hypothetical protein BGO13_05905 [Burkholderiales bacterium 66-5]|nr:MAG: hypothetical protein BGO13_05905 [Burkholderiales bacterium 66-5]